MVSAFISRIIIMVFGTLYPAYASYKAVKTKNVKEYVKWMMYWIVFALFSCVETFADMLVSFWLPFYYEMKILFLVWLLSPATKGSSILYRKFVHPQFNKHEREIDEYISRARDQGYSTVLQLGHKGLQYATTVVMQTALKGQETLVSHLKKSYSMTDLSGPGLLRPSLQYSATLPEVDKQLDELDETGSHLSHRWQSDGELMYTDQSHSADESHSRSPSRYRSKEPSSDTGSLRRTRSVRATRSNPMGGEAPSRTSPTSATTTRSRSSQQDPDTSVYATLPRTKSKVTRKKTSKTN